MRRALTHLRSSDPVMAAIIDRVGPCQLKLSYREPDFRALVRAIVFQQLNGKAATTIFDRLLEAAGGVITPESISNLSLAEMRRVGLSKQKTSYIRDLADHALERRLDFAAFPSMTDEEVIAALTQVKGIGVWTAHMFLMFALRRDNVLPTGDFGIRSAIQKAYRKRKMPDAKTIEKLAKAWHPHCTVACWYLWRSLDEPRERAASAAKKSRVKTPRQ
jgi:DNA-3-methyladenine glycosylase II